MESYRFMKFPVDTAVPMSHLSHRLPLYEMPVVMHAGSDVVESLYYDSLLKFPFRCACIGAANKDVAL